MEGNNMNDTVVSEQGGGKVAKIRLPAKPLPSGIEGWAAARNVKTDRTLNDHVEDSHMALLVHKDEERRERYENLLEAVWDEEAMEGSLSADNLMAAMMIREHASEVMGEGGSPRDAYLKSKKLATIVKALSVVLRRYNSSRKQRRNTVDGEVVPNGDGE